MGDHETEGALGLDGLLAWSQARYVARQAAKPLAPRAARLDEAHGSILASPLLTPYDEPFADGALRVTREVAVTGEARLALGAGAWGAAQRDAARMDIGPTAVTTVPIAGQSLRIARGTHLRPDPACSMNK